MPRGICALRSTYHVLINIFTFVITSYRSCWSFSASGTKFDGSSTVSYCRLKRKIGKTCPNLLNYGDTRCLLKTHPIRQVDPVALQVPSHRGWVCFLDCPLHCLLATPWTHHLATTSYLSVSLIHELYFSGKPTHRTNNSFVPSGRVRLCKPFSMRYWLSEISCSSSGYQLHFTSS